MIDEMDPHRLDSQAREEKKKGRGFCMRMVLKITSIRGSCQSKGLTYQRRYIKQIGSLEIAMAASVSVVTNNVSQVEHLAVRVD